MTTSVLAPQELRIPAPELRGASLQLGSCHDTEILLDGPGGTGKTFGILFYIHVLLLKYPGAKWLVCRKFNVDLAGSAMATYQEQVMNPNEGVYYYGGSKVKPPGYVYPNGSFMAVSGLDRPSKLKSFECDGVYINEATEVDITDLETARMRLRKGVMPWQQIVMDSNPDAPTHWLNCRCNDGATTRLLSRHEDNPRYFNARTQDWTEAGRKYIFGILEGLTGVRYARYRLGLWAASENAVYQDSWDRKRNVIPRFDIPMSWPRYIGLDFGYTNPFVCKWYAEDGDGRLYCYREIYMTKRLVEDHAKQIKAVSRWGEKDGDPFPREVICDHDAEGRETFTRHTGLYTIAAHKAVLEGIQAVATRQLPAGDGKPRLMYFPDTLVERDQELARAKKPTCSIEEVESYIWKQGQGGSTKAKEEPVKENDHGQDVDRYIVARRDLKPGGVSYVPNIWS
jgi:phage terminase large subunit